MKIKYTFEIEVDVTDAAVAGHSPAWVKGAKESADEFAEDMRTWLDKHPFIIACNLKK